MQAYATVNEYKKYEAGVCIWQDINPRLYSGPDINKFNDPDFYCVKDMDSAIEVIGTACPYPALYRGVES